MYIPEELWNEIKLNLIHKIKFGKHNKDDIFIKKYNSIIKSLPKKMKQEYFGEYSIRYRYDVFFSEKYFIYFNNGKFIEVYENQQI